MPFVRIYESRQEDHPTYVNIDHIVSVDASSSEVAVTLSIPNSNGKNTILWTKESVVEIMKRIGEVA